MEWFTEELFGEVILTHAKLTAVESVTFADMLMLDPASTGSGESATVFISGGLVSAAGLIYHVWLDPVRLCSFVHSTSHVKLPVGRLLMLKYWVMPSVMLWFVSSSVPLKINVQAWEEDSWPDSDDQLSPFNWWSDSMLDFVNTGWWWWNYVDVGNCRYCIEFSISTTPIGTSPNGI